LLVAEAREGREMELDEYARQQNLQLYRKLLGELSADDSKRLMLSKMLAEEKMKEAAKAKIHSKY
jgi:hypothetical protein